MRVHKKVLSHNTGEWLLCCFEDCERPGYDNYHVTTHDGFEPFLRGDRVEYEPKLTKFVFCCEGHRQLWLDCIGDGGLQGHYKTGNKGMGRVI